MKTRPTWVRKIRTALITAGVLGLLAGGYLFLQVTSEAGLDDLVRSNVLDAREAERKLKLFNEAQQISRLGFIRLSEVEINSYLHEKFFTETSARTNSPTGGPQMLLSGVRLHTPQVTWYCWVRKRWLGWPVGFVWQRTVEPVRLDNRWAFAPKSMKVGNLEIPNWLWGTVDSQFGTADNLFHQEFDWLTALPTFEVKTNQLSASLELRLYTYPLSASLSHVAR